MTKWRKEKITNRYFQGLTPGRWLTGGKPPPTGEIPQPQPSTPNTQPEDYYDKFGSRDGPIANVLSPVLTWTDCSTFFNGIRDMFRGTERYDMRIPVLPTFARNRGCRQEPPPPEPKPEPEEPQEPQEPPPPPPPPLPERRECVWGDTINFIDINAIKTTSRGISKLKSKWLSVTPVFDTIWINFNPFQNFGWLHHTYCYAIGKIETTTSRKSPIWWQNVPETTETATYAIVSTWGNAGWAKAAGINGTYCQVQPVGSPHSWYVGTNPDQIPNPDYTFSRKDYYGFPWYGWANPPYFPRAAFCLFKNGSGSVEKMADFCNKAWASGDWETAFQYYWTSSYWGGGYIDLKGLEGQYTYEMSLAESFIIGKQGPQGPTKGNICRRRPPSKSPPPPKMPRCCKPRKNQNDDRLLRAMLKRFKKIEEAIGVSDFPAKVPRALFEDSSSQATIKSIPQFLAWYVEQMDGLVGQFPIELEIEDTNLTKEGNQKEKFTIPNLSEGIAELLSFSISNKIINEAQLVTTMDGLVETGENKQMIFKNYSLLQAVQEYLGFATKQKNREMPLTFTPGKDELDEFLKDSKIKVRVEEFSDKRTLSQELKFLLFASSLIKAVFWQALPRDQAGQKAHFKEMLDTLREDDDSDFDQYTEQAEQGFIGEPGISDKNQPYGKPYDQRPKIKNIGKKQS